MEPHFPQKIVKFNNPNLVNLYNYIDISGFPEDKKYISTITEHNIQPEISFSNIEEFVSTFRNDKDLQKVPLPERMYEKFNIPKPEIMSLNSYLFNSIKACMSAGFQSETRTPKDNIIRPMPFISTIHYKDLSGNDCVIHSTIKGDTSL